MTCEDELSGDGGAGFNDDNILLVLFLIMPSTCSNVTTPTVSCGDILVDTSKLLPSPKRVMKPTRVPTTKTMRMVNMRGLRVHGVGISEEVKRKKISNL